MKQKEKFGKERKEKRTHRSSVGRERITHAIRIIGHNMLSSKAIRALSIDCPREMWRVNGLTGSRSPLLQFPTLEVMTKKKEKKKKKKRERLSIYLNSKGMHKVSDFELLIVQLLKKLLSIRNATPPRVIFSISYEVWGKHELKRVHQNLWVILTH